MEIVAGRSHVKTGGERGSLVNKAKVTSAGGKTSKWEKLVSASQMRWNKKYCVWLLFLYASYMQGVAKDGEAVRAVGRRVAGAGQQGVGLLQGVLWGTNAQSCAWTS